MSAHHLRILEGLQWQQEWHATDLLTRHRIEEAVRRGEAADQPDEAALAVGLAIQRRKEMRRQIIAGIVLLITLVAGPSASDVVGPRGIWSILAVALALPGLLYAYRHPIVLRRAEQLNRDVVAAEIRRHRPPPPRSGSIQDLLAEQRRTYGLSESGDTDD